MSWIAKLYETYKQGIKLDLPGENNLIPVSHTLQNAHIHITIDDEGNFQEAEILEKKAQITLPCTEESAGRTSGAAPHPLADKIQYIAGDYKEYGGKKKTYFNKYQKLLGRWCSSEYSHPKAEAVLKYVNKKQVIADLIKARIVFVDENGSLLQSWTGNSNDNETMPELFTVLPKNKGLFEQGDALVCWSVYHGKERESRTWEDETLQQSWIGLDTSDAESEGFCYVLGDEKSSLPIAKNHPAKLRHSGDKAKLISSNDTSGFTFMGRFLCDTQVTNISSEVTQKAHNALRWLITRQGFRNGDQVYVAWAESGEEIPDPLKETHSLLDGLDNLEEIDPDETASTSGNSHASDIGQLFANKLNKYMAGYHARFKNTENIIVMGLDAATPGRMGIIFYREYFVNEFFEQLEQWHKDFAWPQRCKKEIPDGDKKTIKKTIWPVSCPVPKLIAEAAYGKTLSDELRKSTMERILPCIVDGRPIPKDLVDNSVRLASNRNAYGNDDKWEWERNICIASALYKGYSKRNSNDEQREDYEMSLERELDSRDYLYGRLLALAEKIEGFALAIAKEKRLTGAERLMQRFSSRPYSTWKIIDESLRPYRNRIKSSGNAGLLIYWDREIADVCDLFSRDDFTSDKPLSGEYLLGYYCQKNYRKSDNTQTGSEQDKI